MLLAWAAQQGGLYSGYALAFDFKNGVYRSASGLVSAVSSLPGYTYSRAGAKIEPNGGAAAVNFAANTPGIIPGLGGYFRATATNLLLQSQAFDNASWVKGTITTAAPTVTANAGVAPDGTNTAEQLVYPAVSAAGSVSNVNQQVTVVSGINYTFSVWLKGAVGGEQVYIYTTTNGSLFQGAQRVTLTTSWQRFSITILTSATAYFFGIGTDRRDATQLATAGGTVFAWGAGLVTATNSGLDILTTVAAVTVATDALSVSLANGNYSAVYTFDNGTTQTIPTTIGGGTFAMPIYPTTLNRPLIQSVTLK